MLPPNTVEQFIGNLISKFASIRFPAQVAGGNIRRVASNVYKVRCAIAVRDLPDGPMLSNRFHAFIGDVDEALRIYGFDIPEPPRYRIVRPGTIFAGKIY